MSDKKTSFLRHLRELRSSIIRICVFFIIALPVGYLLTDPAITILKNMVPGIQLIYTEVAEMIGTYLKVTLAIAFVFTLPYLIYEVVMFINPALTRSEKKYLYILLPSVIVCFAAGAVFGYLVLLPPAMNFLLTFGTNIATPMIKVSNYVSLIAGLMFWIGICFEIPLVMFFLTKIGLVRAEWLSKFRKIAWLLAFVLGAVITPTFDPVNQTLVALPIIVLYELGVVLSKVARRKEKSPAINPT